MSDSGKDQKMHSMTSKYTIKDLERLSGIKAHTIRIWEQRYNLLNPDRTESNIRLYNDQELKVLLNISLLIRHGGKISHLVKLNQEEIFARILQMVHQPDTVDQFFEAQTDSLVIAMLELDDNRFEKVISTSSLKYGFEQTMLHILIPFLQKVGVMWRTGESNIFQEHFITNLIRKKILVAVDGFSGSVSPQADEYLLYLPDGELHEIGLLFAKYILKVRGKRVIYLGQTVPLSDVIQYCKQYHPKYILTFFTAAYSLDTIYKYLDTASASLDDTQILIAGQQVQSIVPKWKNVTPLASVSDLIQIADHKAL
jgi:DNA-binding transcriptional MerR regulator